MASSADVAMPSPMELQSHLRSLLDAKERQLTQAGALGQQVLAQQMELEERIRQLQALTPGFQLDENGEDEEDVYGGVARNTAGGSGNAGLDKEAVERYRELAATVMQWDEENRMLSSQLASNGLAPPKVRFHLPLSGLKGISMANRGR